MKTLKEQIDAELEKFDKHTGVVTVFRDENGKTYARQDLTGLKEFTEKAFYRIANKTANALEVEERSVCEKGCSVCGEYNQAVQKQKENKDKYLRKQKRLKT